MFRANYAYNSTSFAVNKGTYLASKIYVYYGKIKLLFKNSLYEAKTSYS